jgi:hypothetical protein
MKKQVHPVIIVVAILIVVAGAAAFLVRAVNDKPAYPGMNAGHPAAESGGAGQPDGRTASIPTGTPVTIEQAKKMRIPGMNPNPPSQSGTNTRQ